MTVSTIDSNKVPPSTLNAGSIHTQGNNFLSAVQSSADPRTGQFNLIISVPLGQANELAGPSWPFTLSYSALASQQDNGFGLGWSLQYSQLLQQQNVWTLRLSSGEQFSVDLDKSDLSPGGRLAFHDFKLQSMQVNRAKTDDSNGEASFVVVHKSGEQEILRRLNASGNAYLLHELRSAEGRSLYFDWLRANDVVHLSAVRDEQRTLARYDRVRRTLILEPDSIDESVVQFLLTNGELGLLLLPEIVKPFRFRYENQGVGDQRLRLPVEITGPLGATDSISWSRTLEASHRLPNKAPIAYMPRVVSWLHSDGPGAPVLLRRYQWIGSRNYLGGGSPQSFDWQAGRDSLYRLTTRYEYQSTETQLTGDARTLRWLQSTEQVNSDALTLDVQDLLENVIAAGVVTPLTTITRTWDRHHLLLKEVTLTGDCETTRETTYGVDYDKHWSEQSAQCQLPHLTRTTFTHIPAQTRYAEETSYTYDVFGNTLETHLPTHVREVYEYYPASGDLQGCPYDASGMVRFLKRKTVYPAPDCPGNAPVLCTDYTYQALASLIAGDPDHAVVCREALVEVNAREVLEIIEQTYERDDRSHYGRVTSATSTLNGKRTTTRYDYSLLQEPGKSALLSTRTHIEGFEGTDVSRSTSENTRSLITGLTHCEVDAAGSRTVYEYDRLGRVVRTVIAEGTRYQVQRTCDYHLDDTFIEQYAPRLGDELEVRVALEEVDATGQRKRTWLDGSGRPVLVQLEDLDNDPGVFLEVMRTRYDAWGRPVEETSKDWSTDGSLLFSLSSRIAYDDWGSVSRQTAATGLVSHRLNDPSQRCAAHWSESLTGTVSSTQRTTINSAGSPLETVLFDDLGQPVRTTHYMRDGLDRVVEERSIPVRGNPKVTRFSYDHHGRTLARQELFTQQDQPWVRTVSWLYAAHSDGDHPETVSVAVTQGDLQ